MLDLYALHVFLTVIETGTFSEAGRRLNVSQSAVSQTIHNLEKSLSTELFQRAGRSVRLTETGQALEPMARELVASAQRVEESMVSLHGEVIGEINVGCSTASGKYLLPGLIARFRVQFAHVRLNVIVSSRNSVLTRLVSGELPLGVSSKKVEHHDLEYQNFFTDEVILIAPANHRWANFGSIYPDDLLDEPLILREEAAGSHEVLLEGLHQHDISPDMLRVSMTLGNAEAIEMAVEEGLGVAFISRLAAARGMALGRVVEIKVKDMQLRREIYLARNLRLPAPRAQTEFWDFVRSSRQEIESFVRLENLLPQR